ncbi:MAG TPA: hypothetical protein VFC71_00220 [Candidatus Polarisedimenticolia bacterium]|nr:hypothetical protein [Candidatus Polarisedimenticolia bacterium]
MALHLEPSAPPDDQAGAPRPRTRRAILGAAIGGLAAAVATALGRPAEADAAAGNYLIMGNTANSAGTSNTRLTTSSTGSAWEVVQNGTGTAMRSSANNGIAGYFGSANGTGVSGVVGNASKYGVYGANNGLNFAAGAAIRADGKKNHGVNATSNDPAGIPVRGLHQNTSGSGVGVKGESNASSGIGVHAVSNSPGAGFLEPDPVGLLAEVKTIGSAVQAIVTLPDGWSGGYAVEASAPGGVGVYAYGSQYGALVNGGTYGIYSFGSSYSAYLDGATHVNGTLSKAGGSFRIDHPLDPANKYLQHSFVESPDMKNIYDGVVDLDAAGRAVVTLPDWFDALNRDFRYQLTSIGGRAQAWIAEEIDGGRFTIASDTPKARISWQVTGIRKDAWAKANPVLVEVAKTGPERGRYLHPKEHARSAADGMSSLFKPKQSRG